MALPVYHLRRMLAATAILLTLFVAGMYFYARSRTKNVLNTIPGKIGYDIKQTAKGFQFSKSDGKRTLFTVEASDIKEFKLNGKAELHNVSIILYGRDSSRYDQIYGDDFSYDQKTGDVSAKGDVQIDLVANPSGAVSPDQSVPSELKNPIHLKTRDLVFNKNTGNASTDARVEFSTPQASGWAVGVKYTGKNNTLTLSSNIHVGVSGPEPLVIDAQHGTLTNDPREVVLDHPLLHRMSGTLQADQATFYLSPENHVERIVANRNIRTQVRTEAASKHSKKPKQVSEVLARADHAEFLFINDEDLLRTATLTGNVHVEQRGAESVQGDSGRMVLDFRGNNELKTVHALDGAHLKQVASAAEPPGKNSPQHFDLTAAAIDFDVQDGHVLKRAVTSGPAQMTITQAASYPGAKQNSGASQTVVTAGKFDAEFMEVDGRNSLTRIHGAPNARIVNSSPGQPDRITMSDSVDANFLPEGGIEAITQTGHFAYSDNNPSVDKRMQAWGKSARYTPENQIITLTGDPRVQQGGMETTADTVRIDRSTGDAQAEGSVKSTYNNVKEDPNGALLASSSPIHVTARSMTAHSSPAIATYSGKARLWQDANVIEAPSIEFERQRRSVVAEGTATHPVQTILVQPEKPRAGADNPSGKSKELGPLTITAHKLTYTDPARVVRYTGGVLAKGSDFTAAANSADAYLLPRSQGASSKGVTGPGQLDRMVAEGNVLIQQPTRRAEGRKLLYTAAEEKFVLTGGPPSIFDAERGKITGVSLTFFRRDDRVLVEGEASSSVVSTTRVAP